MVKRYPVDNPVSPDKLAEPLVFPVSKRVARNRFLKSALTERVSTFVNGFPEKSGIPTTELCNMYEKFSHGEFGVLLTGNTMVDPWHLEAAGNMIIHQSVDSPERRAAFKNLASAMKAVSGNLAICQIGNAGRQTPLAICKHPISASDVQLQSGLRGTSYGVPRALTVEEIKNDVIGDFVYAAKYLFEAGFDGIELHSAHGYLLAQFVSLTTNKRTDQYGGSWRNRCRLQLEIYEAIRREIPAETGFIVGIKMNSVEFQAGGLDVNEAVFMCREYEKIGFDFIELSGGTYEKLLFEHFKESTVKREAYFLEFAKKIKEGLSTVVVYLTGGFRTVPGMVQAIEDGACQGIGLGRPITFELDLPAKILAGKVQAAVFSPYEKQYFTSLELSDLQMWQAQQTNIRQVDDVNEGIINFAVDGQQAVFEKEFEKYVQDTVETAELGKPVHGVMHLKLEDLPRLQKL